MNNLCSLRVSFFFQSFIRLFQNLYFLLFFNPILAHIAVHTSDFFKVLKVEGFKVRICLVIGRVEPIFVLKKLNLLTFILAPEIRKFDLQVLNFLGVLCSQVFHFIQEAVIHFLQGLIMLHLKILQFLLNLIVMIIYFSLWNLLILHNPLFNTSELKFNFFPLQLLLLGLKLALTLQPLHFEEQVLIFLFQVLYLNL